MANDIGVPAALARSTNGFTSVADFTPACLNWLLSVIA